MLVQAVQAGGMGNFDANYFIIFPCYRKLVLSHAVPPAFFSDNEPILIRYSILPKHPAAHIYEVSVTIEKPAADGQRFMLPVWIPGSYMIREFARHIVTLKAESEGRGPNTVLRCEKIDKATWRCEAEPGVTLIRGDGCDISPVGVNTMPFLPSPSPSLQYNNNP